MPLLGYAKQAAGKRAIRGAQRVPRRSAVGRSAAAAVGRSAGRPVAVTMRSVGRVAVSVSRQFKFHKNEVLTPGAHTLFEPGEAGAARANPHSNPVVPYYAAGRDSSWYLAGGPPNCSYTVVDIRCGSMNCIHSPLRDHGKHLSTLTPCERSVSSLPTTSESRPPWLGVDSFSV